jgi:SAM-dependent methyltransferase
VADLPLELSPDLAERLGDAFDRERKIARALEALGPVGDRDVVVLDGAGGRRATELRELGARLTHVPPAPRFIDTGLPAASADAIVSMWHGFRGVDAEEIAEADRVLRPGGRLLIVHDYGRDDVSRLRGEDLPEYGAWSRRDGPFLRGGFRIRVLHCWWTWEALEEARDFLAAAFGEVGAMVAAGLKRPRLSYNVAVYHRSTRFPSGQAVADVG